MTHSSRIKAKNFVRIELELRVLSSEKKSLSSLEGIHDCRAASRGNKKRNRLNGTGISIGNDAR